MAIAVPQGVVVRRDVNERPQHADLKAVPEVSLVLGDYEIVNELAGTRVVVEVKSLPDLFDMTMTNDGTARHKRQVNNAKEAGNVTMGILFVSCDYKELFSRHVAQEQRILRRLRNTKSLSSTRGREVMREIRSIIAEYAAIGWEVVFVPDGVNPEALLIELIQSTASTEWHEGRWIDHPLHARSDIGNAYATSLAFFALNEGETVFIPPCVRTMMDPAEMRLAVYRAARQSGLLGNVPAKAFLIVVITMVIRYCLLRAGRFTGAEWWKAPANELFAWGETALKPALDDRLNKPRGKQSHDRNVTWTTRDISNLLIQEAQDQMQFHNGRGLLEGCWARGLQQQLVRAGLCHNCASCPWAGFSNRDGERPVEWSALTQLEGFVPLLDQLRRLDALSKERASITRKEVGPLYIYNFKESTLVSVGGVGKARFRRLISIGISYGIIGALEYLHKRRAGPIKVTTLYVPKVLIHGDSRVFVDWILELRRQLLSPNPPSFIPWYRSEKKILCWMRYGRGQPGLPLRPFIATVMQLCELTGDDAVQVLTDLGISKPSVVMKQAAGLFNQVSSALVNSSQKQKLRAIRDQVPAKSHPLEIAEMSL